MAEQAFIPLDQVIAFGSKPELKVQDPFNTKVKGKDQSRMPAGARIPVFSPTQTAEK